MTHFVYTGVVVGVDGQRVCVEASLRPGIPYFDLVGLAGTALKEARIRVEQAVRASGYSWPRKRIVLNLAPADLRKEGSALDLALAVACLAEGESIDQSRLDQSVCLGELSLDGRLQPVRGVLPILERAQKSGARYAVVPAQNAREAGLIHGLEVIACPDLKSALTWLKTGRYVPAPPAEPEPLPVEEAVSWAELRGQAQAKRAAEIALTGGHNLLLVGPPGTGKTLLARALPSLMPPLEGQELLEVLRIRSVVEGEAPAAISARPFRAPHHSISTAGMVGGGNPLRPGEVTIAHGGILFLDEFSEFPRGALEALRQPLEDGHLTMTRAGCRVRFPACVMIVAASNPCPCGFYGSLERGCRCAPSTVARYQSKISGPILDRIDLQVRMERPSAGAVLDEQEAGCDDPIELRARIAAARRRADQRQGCANANLSGQIVKTVDATSQALAILERSADRLNLSPRAVTRLLKVARSIADLAGAERIEPGHLAEAFELRVAGLGEAV